jgi:type IV secretory pathway VirB2 component (pilin)
MMENTYQIDTSNTTPPTPTLTASSFSTVRPNRRAREHKRTVSASSQVSTATNLTVHDDATTFTSEGDESSDVGGAQPVIQFGTDIFNSVSGVVLEIIAFSFVCLYCLSLLSGESFFGVILVCIH